MTMKLLKLHFFFLSREPVGLSVFSDDETDLIRELQTMCSSKSEPDISKVQSHVTVSSPPSVCLVAVVCKCQILKVYQCLLLDQNLYSKWIFFFFAFILAPDS